MIPCHRHRPPIAFFFGWAIAFALVIAPLHASASTPEEQVAELVEAAEEEYDFLEFEAAVGLIQAGLTLADEENLRTSEVADLHILLGLIRHADGDDDLAIDAFIDAIETYPDAEIASHYITPALQEMMDTARERAEPPPEEPDEPDEPVADDPSPDIDAPPPEEDVDPLTHEVIRRADAGQSLQIDAEIPADLPVFRVHVHHRRYGESDFVQAEMEPTDATGFAVTIDGAQVRTSQLDYFITAIDRAGEVVAESGRATNPHRISVIGDIDAPVDDDPDAPDTPSPDDPDRPDTDDVGFYGTLAFGTDVGFLPGGTAPTANVDRDVRPGIAPAFAHYTLNLGWRITDHNNIGLYFRHQLFPNTNFDELPDDAIDESASFYRHERECFGLGLSGDCLLGVQYQRIISSGVPEFYSSVGLGIGRVRNYLKLKQPHDDDDSSSLCDGREVHQDDQIGPYCELRDSVRTGWTHFGVGGGMLVPVIDNLDLVADSYLMILVPDTSVNLDVNVGMRVTF